MIKSSDAGSNRLQRLTCSSDRKRFICPQLNGVDPSRQRVKGERM
jgi:hypothetical protein